MHPNELSKEEKIHSIIYGAIVGVFAIILAVISIFYTNSSTSYSSLFLVSTASKIISSILFPVFFVYLLKKKSGTLWTFSKALKSIYILLATSIILSSVGLTLAEKVFINEDVVRAGYQNLMNLKIENMEANKATDEEIDTQMEVIEQSRDFAVEPLTFKSITAPMFISLLVNFIFALVLAFLFRSPVQKKA